jgi:cytochrome c oxidase cbb3-type subunit IV
MLKYIKQHMLTIDGIEIFPLISLIIFTLFFAGLLWWVFSAKKSTMAEMSSYPLNDDEIKVK